MAHPSVVVSGSRNEPFYELLHPDIALGPSPSNPSGGSAQNGLIEGDDPASNSDSSADDLIPSFEPQPIQGGSPSKAIDAAPVVKVEDKALVGNLGRHSSASSSAEAKVYLSSEPTQTHELLKSKQDRELFSSVTVAAVERTMKKYADDILHVLEGINTRLSQLETTALRLDYSIEGLKKVGGENHGDIDNRLRKLENLFMEVQTGVQVLRDKQEIAEAQSQYLKMQLPQNTYVASSRGTSSAPVPDGPQQPKAEVPQHHIVPSPPPPPPTLPSLHALPSLAVPSPPQPEAQPTQVNVPPHSHQAFPAAVAAIVQNEHPIQQLTLPSSPQHRPAASSLLQQTSHSSQPSSFYSQHAQFQQVPQGSYSQQPEAPPYTYVPSSQHPAAPAPSSNSYAPEAPQYVPGSYGGPPPQLPPEQILRTPPPQLHTSVGQQYEPPMGRTGSSFPQAHAFSAASMSEQQSGGYGSPPYRVAQPVPSAPSGGSYPRLPAAQPLKHALPASGVGSGTSGGDSLPTNRVPVDELIEKVAQMGFSRDQVRTVVRRLTENGQAVDLNVVLDKLMNGEIQPQKGWFGR